MKAIPHEKELLAHFGPQRFAIVGVNADKNPTEALDAVAEYGITWRSFQVKKEDGTSIADDWHVGGYPTFYLLDTEGLIARIWQGVPPQREWHAAIAELLGEL
jgi:hypothetical protein